MPIPKLTVEILNAALLGFEEQKKRIDAQAAEIRQMLAGEKAIPESAVTPAPTKRKRRMSAAGRKAIAEAQRKRWAASKKAAAVNTVPAVTQTASTKQARAKKAQAKTAAAKKAAAKKPQKKAKAPEAAAPAQAQ